MQNNHSFEEAFEQFLSSRKSVGAKFLTEPAPSLEDYRAAIKAALAVPDHMRLHPCRVVVINNRQRLADLFAQGLLETGGSEEEVDKAKSKALKAPAMLALVVSIDPNNPRVPEYEQWMTAGGFLTVFLNVLEARGFSGKIVSGSNTRYPLVVSELCNPGEKVAAWIMLGTEVKDVQFDIKRPSADDYLSEWS